MQDKAYKILAKQEKISHNTAKSLIDSGLVFCGAQKVAIARALMSENSRFIVKKPQKARLIYEDDKIIAVNKPFAMKSEDLEKAFGAKLLNRLDKETSGLILLYKDENFRAKCIEEFKKQKVYKSYLAIVSGVLADEITINEPILTLKSKQGAFSKVSKEGLSAQTTIAPLLVSGKKTLIKALIATGRTHQIRVHCAHIKHGIIGDEKYAKISSKRMFLHSFELGIFDYKFRANLDESFNEFGFEIKNLDFKGI